MLHLFGFRTGAAWSQQKARIKLRKPDMDTIISELHSKFAGRSWNDTYQLVRRCMDRSRHGDKPYEALQRSMQRLQEVLSMSSVNAVKTRLETIAKHHGLSFHMAGDACYLTADLFYLEVALLSSGGVKAVTVAPHGGAPVASALFLELLRCHDFVKFSDKLGDLSRQYNIPGDNELKLKLFEALQALGKDLEQLSKFQKTSHVSSHQTDFINDGIVGSVTAGKEGGPLTVQFYVSPEYKTLETEPLVHTAQLTVALSDVPRRLQVSSSVTQPPQLDIQGRPVFKSPSEESCDQLPACFLLKLQPAVVMIPSLWNKLNQITDVAVRDVDLQWAPLPHVLRAHDPEVTPEEQDVVSAVSVAGGGLHSYVFPSEAWAGPAHKGALVDEVPFTHLSHVPAILELLRHQSSINSVLRSALMSTSTVPSRPELHFEVLPETDTSFTVTFHPPDTDSLSVLVVDFPGARQVTCRLFGAGLNDSPMEECVSNVMKRSHSLPVTLQTLCSKLKERSCGFVSPDLPPVPETDCDHVAASPCPGAVSASGSAAVSVSQSQPVPEINLPLDHYPLPPTGVFLPWRPDAI